LDPEVSSPPFFSLSLSLLFSPCARPLFFPCACGPALPCRRGARPLPSPARAAPTSPAGAARGPHPSPARSGTAPPVPCPRQRGPALLPCSCGTAPGAARPPAPARRLGPRRGVLGPCARSRPLRAASHPSAWLAWPRRGLALPPFTPNTFPRAQPHLRGDYSWFLVNFKLH
jgi:hypothetical protein